MPLKAILDVHMWKLRAQLICELYHEHFYIEESTVFAQEEIKIQRKNCRKLKWNTIRKIEFSSLNVLIESNKCMIKYLMSFLTLYFIQNFDKELTFQNL